MRRRKRTKTPILSSRAAYSQWAKHYPPFAHNPLMQAEQDAMLRLLPDMRDRIVIDLACGTGRYSRIAQAQGARHVIGLDNSPAMLRAGVGGVPFVQADITAIPLPASYASHVICALAIGHVPDITPVLKEIHRILDVNGLALISDFHPQLFAAGGQRTFTGANNRTYAVEHYPHTIHTVTQQAQRIGFHTEEIATPQLTIAGELRPAVVVYRLRAVY